MSLKIRAKKKQSLSLVTLLPEDIIIDILARVRRCDYLTLSLVSKHFRSLIASRELYASRSLLGCTEHCLYVILWNGETWDYRLYILCRKANVNHHLVPISSLPHMRYRGSFVVVGSRIYVFGGFDPKDIALSIDCRSHTVQTLPSMPVPMSDTIANIIDGRIYVTGIFESKKVMVVFNTETQMWEHRKIMPDNLGDTRNAKMSFVYMPLENSWKRDEMMNLSNKLKNSCVVDDVLYYYDDNCAKNKLKAYDQKKKCWGVVNGLENLSAEMTHSLWPEIVSYGRRLALFWCRREEIWCAEISLERRQEGEIWGKVEWCDYLMSGNLRFWKSLAVMV
ncbi:hypothetical protein EUTSA_v10016904mg [Eutrema salsugineum]|uniref:F-box domain-containing protein n=1 Tax=Eutrema salsugineum TaxID=72664 RepID=V4M5J9_EUTSA|nr:F-box/kelch-repeat protein At4g38940 [Eutrema salsugineum]ESQ51494.1 hypothetical protein EUTSA_v10016904mg [Eutrema salsugineum]